MNDGGFAVERLDHLVLTVADLCQSTDFYARVLGMNAHEFVAADGSRRWALSFGEQKINLHVAGREFQPKARAATPGSADLCFLTKRPLADWKAHLAAFDIEIEAGPLPRTGARSAILSLYIRDPDGNLIEISNALP